MRWWLCVLLALALLHPTFSWQCERARADDMVEFADDDFEEFADFDEFVDDADAEFDDDQIGPPPPSPSPPGQPVPMDMTLAQFIDGYNAACADDVRVQEPVDRDGTVFGVTFLAAGDKIGVYAQLAIDPACGQVLVAGAKLDASEDDQDLAGFAAVAAAVMTVAFPDLPGERRESLLTQVMATDGTTQADGQCVTSYVVYDDGERTMLMYVSG